MAFFSGSRDAALATHLARIERKIDVLLAHLQIEVPRDNMDDIRELIVSGQTIAAIKAYRARTGAGLAEAKDAIDRGL